MTLIDTKSKTSEEKHSPVACISSYFSCAFDTSFSALQHSKPRSSFSYLFYNINLLLFVANLFQFSPCPRMASLIVHDCVNTGDIIHVQTVRDTYTQHLLRLSFVKNIFESRAGLDYDNVCTYLSYL